MTDRSTEEILSRLTKLQKLDCKIDSLVRKIESSPESLKNLEKRLASEKKKVEAKKEELSELEKKKRQTDGALQLNEERIQKNEERMTSIKTNDEYRSALKEIDTLKKNNSDLEESVLLLLEDIDKGKKEILNHEEIITTLEKEFNEESEKFKSMVGDVEKELEEASGNRKELLEGIEKKYLSQYERIRKNRFGVAVVQVISGNCTGCHMSIPPQLYNQLIRGGQIYQCPNCHRIIFYTKPQENVEA